MSLILGGGALTSRLSTSIRDDQGLAYSVYGYFDASLYPGPFRVGLGRTPRTPRRPWPRSSRRSSASAGTA